MNAVDYAAFSERELKLSEGVYNRDNHGWNERKHQLPLLLVMTCSDMIWAAVWVMENLISKIGIK